MERRDYLRRLGVGATIGVTGIAGCAGGDDGAATETGDGTATAAGGGTVTETTGGTEGGGQAAATVAMRTQDEDYYFDPIGLFVEPGETVTWVNENGAHSSAAYVEGNPQAEVNRIPEGAEGWDSGILDESGAEFSHTFETEGTYDYYCTPHKSLGMVGRLVVGEPSGLEGNPPDGPVPSEQQIVDAGAVTFDEFDGQ